MLRVQCLPNGTWEILRTSPVTVDNVQKFRTDVLAEGGPEPPLLTAGEWTTLTCEAIGPLIRLWRGTTLLAEAHDSTFDAGRACPEGLRVGFNYDASLAEHDVETGFDLRELTVRQRGYKPPANWVLVRQQDYSAASANSDAIASPVVKRGVVDGRAFVELTPESGGQFHPLAVERNLAPPFAISCLMRREGAASCLWWFRSVRPPAERPQDGDYLQLSLTHQDRWVVQRQSPATGLSVSPDLAEGAWPVAAGDWAEFAAEVIDNRLRVFVNGEFVADVADPFPLPAENHNLETLLQLIPRGNIRNGKLRRLEIDDWRIWRPPPP